jgi:hypothetical protein
MTNPKRCCRESLTASDGRPLAALEGGAALTGSGSIETEDRETTKTSPWTL